MAEKMVSVADYIKGIKTASDVMNLAGSLKRMEMDERTIKSLVAKGRTQLLMVDEKEYDKYIKYVGCHTQLNKDYGCMDYDVNCNHGGSIHISDWVDHEDDTSLAIISISNGWGMGGSNYINNLKDIEKEIRNVKQITWIDSEEREFLIDALENLKRGIK